MLFMDFLEVSIVFFFGFSKFHALEGCLGCVCCFLYVVFGVGFFVVICFLSMVFLFRRCSGCL